MKILTTTILTTLGFFCFSNFIFKFSALKAVEIKEDKSLNFINIDYLKKFQNSEYILGIGDEINVIVSRQYPELNTQAVISEDGTVYLPKLNKVFINGLTITELTSLLNKAFLEFVKYPNVEITINNYRPLSVLVQGEVSKSQIYTLDGTIQVNDKSRINKSNYFPTVFDAIRAGGGITDYADLSRVEIIRKETLSNKGGKKKKLLSIF